MNVQFSTNNRHEAEARMTSALGQHAVAFKPFIEYVGALVEQGCVRIGDPKMYGHAQIFPTEKCTDEMEKLIGENYKKALELI